MPYFYFPSLVIPEKLVELIRRDYKGAVLCPFPWCEDELQLKLSNIFTRLQIVSRRKERSKLTHSTVNMTEIFKSHPECHNPRVVLIEGNPGMGKTTYCQKLAYDWSVEEIPSDASFPEVKILLLLKCRDMHMKTANIEEAIDDQLLPHDMGKKEKEDFFHFIHSNQSRILLALDGFDELREDLVQGFLPLIQGKVFANVYLMLTARHEAGMRVRRYCDTLLEIVGYTRDDVEGYIKKYFSSREDQSLADKMIEKLDSDKHLRELTVNPLNTALLCLLCEEKRGVFPSKKTMMYDDLVSCALRGYFAKKGISLGDEDPVERCASELNQLGEMAFEALLKTQLHFSEGEVKSQHQVDFLRLPFLSREPSVSKIKPKPCYAFTHKTFQEYFAAFYLAHQLLSGYKEKENLLDELSPIDNWQVWEFLILMVSSKSVEVAEAVVSQLCAFDYKKSFHSLIDDNVDFGVQIFDKENHSWVTEIAKWSRDENSVSDVLRKTLDLIAECEDGDSKLKDYQRKMVHVLARRFPLKKLELAVSARNCYVCSEYLKSCYTLTDLTLNNPSALGRLTKRFNGLRLNEAKLGNQSIETLLKKVFQPRSISTHLSIGGILISMAGCQIIATFLQTNRSLTHLNVGSTQICDRGAAALGNALGSACTLTHLNLRDNMITAVGAAAIATSLQSNSGLIYLDLSWNKGGDSGAVALAQALESNRALKYLVLENNGIGLKGGAALARALRFNRTLTYLDLTGNTIGDSGAEAFGEVLRTNISLTQLNLQCNEIEGEGAEALGKALQSNITLTHLSLRLNNYAGNSYKAPLAITRALRSSGTRLTRLDLSFTGFICSAITAALRTNSSLTHVRFCSNGISCGGASLFAKGLKLNRTLTHLDLRQNDIRNSGAEELAYALKNYNNTMVYLDLRNNFGIMSEGRESLEQIDQSKCIVKY